MFSQIFNGKLINSELGEAVEFANIGIIGKNVGTVSDEHGLFSIQLDDLYNKDTLKISCIGFVALKFEIATFKRENESAKVVELKLHRSVTSLKEIVINPKKYVTKTLGNTSNSGSIIAGFETNDLGSEVGTVMKIRKAPTFIETVNFNIAKNTYDSVTFRINIYKMKNEFPSENILLEPIYVTTKIKHGTLIVDLKKYNLVVEEDFFVSIEWIKSLEGHGLYFCGGIINQDDSFSRKTSQGDWKKVPTLGLGFNTIVTYEK